MYTSILMPSSTCKILSWSAVGRCCKPKHYNQIGKGVHSSTPNSSGTEHHCRKIVEKSLKGLEAAVRDGQLAFAGKSNKELLRSYLVLRLCSYGAFTKNAARIFTTLYECIGTKLFSAVFKPTIYKNFIAGDSKEEVLATASSLAQSGLMPLVSPMLEDSPDSVGFSEAVYIKNKEAIRESIDVCSQLEYKNGPKCLAVKLSALIPSQILADLTKALDSEETISKEQIVELSKAFDSGTVGDLRLLRLGPKERDRLRACIPNIVWLGEECRLKEVSVYIDAEYSSFQPGVRLIALTLMNIYNREYHTVWNTYQCYLKKTERHVREDTTLLDSIGVRWAGKIVRGAYMQHERNAAKELNREDPIQDSFEKTSSAYDRTARYLLSGLSAGSNWRLILATHNEASVLAASQLSLALGVQEGVYYGQIAGMGESLSCGLAQTGFSVYKLVPTGSVEEVLPWLARRMQENGGMRERAKRDRELIFAELCRRANFFSK